MAEGAGNLAQTGEKSQKLRRGPLQGRVLAVEAGHRGDHQRAPQASVREWCGYGHTRRQDISVVTEPYTIATLFGISFTWTQEGDTGSCCHLLQRCDSVH